MERYTAVLARRPDCRGAYMNRASKRKAMKSIKGQAKQKFTLLELQKAISIALEMKKESRGHLFNVHTKERCVFCGVGRRTKKECEWWLLTFIDRLQTILLNPDFFIGQDYQANYLQHGDEYQDIVIPTKEHISE